MEGAPIRRLAAIAWLSLLGGCSPLEIPSPRATCADAPCDPLATCADSDAGPVCTCPLGYADDGETCTDLDECLGEGGGASCHEDASCTNTSGGFACACDEGFAGDGVHCVPLADCEIGPALCDVHAACTHVGGGMRCVCDDGYEGDGASCADVDECDQGLDDCDALVSCTDNEGGFACGACPGGYEDTNGDGTACRDFDECVGEGGGANCHADAGCTNIAGSFTCACDEGFGGDGITCVPLADCAVGPAVCDPNAACEDLGGGEMRCVCDDGFEGDGATCADIDECDRGLDDCDDLVVCVDNDGGFACGACPDRYEDTNDDGTACRDFDECAGENGGNNCHADATCTNTPGLFGCECDPGFTGDGVACVTLTDCQAGPAVCHTDAQCLDVAGEMRCVCDEGFEGDGAECSDVDECEGDPCDPLAGCANEPGTYACGDCPAGYEDTNGDGTACRDYDECAGENGGDNCDPLVVCTSTPGTYACGACPTGYEDTNGDGTACRDYDECAGENGGYSCDPLVVCSNAPGSFTCSACPEGFADANGDNSLCVRTRLTGHPFRVVQDPPGTANDVFVQGDFAYVASDGYGLEIVDISTPTSPQRVATFGSGAREHIFVSGPFAYLTRLAPGLTDIVDVSTPTAPSLAGSLPRMRDLAVVGDLVYAARGSSGLTIYRVTTPSSPVTLGTANTSGSANGVFVVDDLAYVACGGAGLQIVEIQTPTEPFIVGGVDTPGVALAIFVEGDRAYVADEDSVQVVDVSEPWAPVLMGNVTTGALDISVAGNRAYVAVGQGSTPGMAVAIIDVSNPLSPTLLARAAMPGSVEGVSIKDDHVYAATWAAGLSVLGLDALPISSLAGTIVTTDWAMDVAATGDHALVMVHNFNEDTAVEIVDVANSANPLPLSRVDVPWSDHIEVSADHAYLAGGALTMVDISDPVAPFVRPPFPFSGGGFMFVGPNRVYMGYLGLSVLDITTPASPIELGLSQDGPAGPFFVRDEKAFAIDYSGDRFDVFDVAEPIPSSCPVIGSVYVGSAWTAWKAIQVSSDFAYILGGNLTVVDVSDPSAPSKVAEVLSWGVDMAMAGNKIYVAAAEAGVEIFDAALPAQPFLAGTYDTPGYALGVVVHDGRAFVADRAAGMHIIDLIDPTLTPDLTQAPAGSLQTYTVTWPPQAAHAGVRCRATSGTCTVTAVDTVNREATITWTLPTFPGPQALSVAVGNWSYFISAHEDVLVQ